MAVLAYPRRYGRQSPPVGASINYGHPLAQGLILALRGGPPVDPIRGPLTITDPTNNFASTGLRGPVLHQNATAGSNGSWGYGSSSFVPTTAFTCVIAKRKLDATNRSCAGFGLGGATVAARCGTHLPFSDSTVYWDFGGNASPNRLSVSGLTFGDDVWAFVAGTRGSSIWQNGLQRASQTTAITRSASAVDNFLVGDGNGVTDTDLCDIAFAYAWSRELTPSEIQWLVVEPYAFFSQAPSDRIWVPTALRPPSVIVAPPWAQTRASSW